MFHTNTLLFLFVDVAYGGGRDSDPGGRIAGGREGGGRAGAILLEGSH